ncbi:Tpr-related family member [Babesia ovata]|uniref:Tpr-related family member n=1 Tax=Babesia ovata TaxID=189622 RepID=A0A2H6KHX5_9APIC|nr:Tpr-related family member [Babesia ovata]GBE62596.1 Tpr-related family member [Babesia ovata]
MEIFYLFSALTTFGILTALRSIWGLNADRYAAYGCVCSAWVIVIVNVFLLKSFALGKGNETVTLYFWMLIAANCVAGIDDMFMFTVASDDVSSYDLGASFTGIVVGLFHWCALIILKKRKMDVNYWLIFYQLFAILTLSLCTAAIWTWYTFQGGLLDKITKKEASQGTGKGGVDSEKDQTFLQAYWATFAMTAMSSMGYGFIYVIYPLISPFEMVEFEHQHPIQTACLVIHAVSGILVCILDKYCELGKKWAGSRAYYHFIWLLAIPFLGIGFMFIRVMHYPKSLIAKGVRMKPVLVGFLTVIYYFSGRFFIGAACAAIDGNAKKGDSEASDVKKSDCENSAATGSPGGTQADSNASAAQDAKKSDHASTISSMNLALNLLVLNIIKYISEAYIEHFREVREEYEYGEPWPTEGMGEREAFFYWLKQGAVLGFKNFRKLAVQNIKAKLSPYIAQ